MLIIQTDRLVGGYCQRPVLREVSLQVPAGCIYGFLGPNGAGKTTALRTVLGLLRPFSGTIHLFGQPLKKALPLAFRRIGSLIEQPSLYLHLTGRENLEIVRRLKGLTRSSCDIFIEELALNSFIDRKSNQYSRGMRQRLGVAIAMLGNPDLLLLDEPTNGMDVSGLDAFRALLLRLHREHGMTILLSSHQFGEVDQVATHVGILSGMGDLLFQGTRRELSERIPQRLVVKVRQREEALGILRSHGFTVDCHEESLAIPEAVNQTASEVNRLLVSNGIDVYHLRIELTTLDALFAEVIGTIKPWEAAR